MSNYRKEKLTTTTSAVAWNLTVAEDVQVRSIMIKFASVPSTSEDVKVWLKSADGTEYDTLLASLDNNVASLVFQDLPVIDAEDYIQVTYTNTDGIATSGTALVEL